MKRDTSSTGKKMQVDAMRDYYVKLDNFILENIELHGFKRIQSISSGPELLKNVIAYYQFDLKNSAHITLWSSPNRLSATLVRLDTMEIIPDEYEFIWVRGK